MTQCRFHVVRDHVFLQSMRLQLRWFPEHIQAGAQSGERVARYVIGTLSAPPIIFPVAAMSLQIASAVGCSGGGALTTFIRALDPRVKVVGPACYTNSSYRLQSKKAAPPADRVENISVRVDVAINRRGGKPGFRRDIDERALKRPSRHGPTSACPDAHPSPIR
jgi:hypothetical protein